MRSYTGLPFAVCAAILTMTGCSSEGPSPTNMTGTSGNGGQAGSNKSGSGGGPGIGGKSGADAAFTSDGTAGAGGTGGTGDTRAGGDPSQGGRTGTGGNTSVVGGSGIDAGSEAGGTSTGIDANLAAKQSPDLITATKPEGWLQLFDDFGPLDQSALCTAFGPWSTYKSTGGACTIKPDGRPTRGATGICFSGQGCGATDGAGLRVPLCTTYPAYEHWVPMKTFVANHGMAGNNVEYGFGSCNTGRRIIALNWEGAVPAGTKIDLQDPTHASIGSVVVAAGAKSVAVPATTDGGKIASIHFYLEGAAAKSWDFCLAKLTLSYL